MTSNDGGLTWNGTINRTLEMNRLDNILTVSGEYHSSSISFDVLENNNLLEIFPEKLGDDIYGEDQITEVVIQYRYQVMAP